MTLTPTVGGRDLCAATCTHRSCAYLRALIESPCLVCGSSIGQGVAYLTRRDGRLHERCEIRTAAPLVGVIPGDATATRRVAG